MNGHGWRWLRKSSIAIVLLLFFANLSAGEEQVDRLVEAQRLNDQALEYYEKGDYVRAIPLARRALNIRRKTVGPDHPDTATSLNNLALLYDATGAYARAETLYKRALAIRQKTLGAEHPDTAVTLNNLAEVYHTIGAYDKAEPLYQRALAIRESKLGSEAPETAASLNNLAALYHDLGLYAKAEPLYERALAVTEKARGPEHPDTAVSLNNLAAYYYGVGAYAKAEPLYQRALAVIEKASGAWHPDAARTLNNLAALYRDLGEYTKAEPLFRRALDIYAKALDPEHPDIAYTLSNLGLLYYEIGAYTTAEPLYRRSLDIREKSFGPENRETAASLNSLAGLYAATGAYAAAEQLYKRALLIRERTLGPEHPDTASSVNNLAERYRESGAYTKAETLHLRALAIIEKAVGPDHPLCALSLNNLALLYDETGDYAKAEPLYQRALAIREKALGPMHPDTALSLNSLASLYKDTGAYEKAEPLFQRAIAIREKSLGPEHPDTAQSLSDLALLYESMGSYEKATPLYSRAQEIFDMNTARFLLGGDETRKRDYLQQRRGDANADVSFSLTATERSAKELGLMAVLRYKGRVLSVMADSAALLRRSVAPGDRAIFDELAAVAQQASTLTFRGPGNLPVEAFRERLDELTREQKRLENELSSRSATFRQAVAPITLESVRGALPTDAALAEWFRYRPFDPKAKDEKAKWGAPRYVAYVLRREGEPAAIDLGAADDIDKLVNDFRVALRDPTSSSYKEVAATLFGRLIKPLQTSLSGVDRLLLSPDAALNLLPFAALMDERGDYLAQGFELTYLTSGRDLLSLATSEPGRGSAVVMADPAYGPSTSGTPSDIGLYRSIDLDRSGLVFAPLPDTAEEARALQKLLNLDANAVFTGVDATEETLKGLHSPRILHVATHGFFLSDRSAATAFPPTSVGGEATPLPPGENPLLRSGLALAGANARRSGESDDGILTAAEAAQLDLRGTQLVVLSACETGLGEVQQGEGVYGLRRALVLAGAEAQLVSLWKVADAQTRTLMEEYYGRLLKGDGRSAALREAQEAMIANPATRHPYYWAAFVLVGNGTPLAMKGSVAP
jgi:CHAT domain-containing protein/Tfp pilus assembly protein PilF